MSKQVKWTADIVRKFSEKAMLNEDEIFVLVTRVKGMPISRQAQELNCSESTINRMISNLKKKYDCVQKEYPDEFPVRKSSAKETWMDEH